MDLIVGSGEKAVKVAGLKSVDTENFSAFDGITLTLKGGVVDNFSDLTITGGIAPSAVVSSEWLAIRESNATSSPNHQPLTTVAKRLMFGASFGRAKQAA